jgi:hypothetical protein
LATFPNGLYLSPWGGITREPLDDMGEGLAPMLPLSVGVL